MKFDFIEPYTKPGQIEVGDLLLIDNGKTIFAAACKQVCQPDTDPEIVINMKKNHYFITSLYLSGESWVKEVKIVRR